MPGNLGRLQLRGHAPRSQPRRRACARHRVDRRGQSAHQRNARRAGCARLPIVKPIDIRQQQHAIGRARLRHARRQPVVVAKPDFLRRHRIVLVDHRHRARIEQPAQRGGHVEIAPPVLQIVERQQHLRCNQPVRAQQFRPQPRQRDLAHRRRRLRIGQAAASALRQTQPPRAQRNRTRTDHDHLLALGARRRDLADERREPITPRLAIAAHQQRRADLDDKARGEGGIGK